AEPGASQRLAGGETFELGKPRGEEGYVGAWVQPRCLLARPSLQRPEVFQGREDVLARGSSRLFAPLALRAHNAIQDHLHVVGLDRRSRVGQVWAYTLQNDFTEEPIVARQHQQEQQAPVAGRICGGYTFEKGLVFWRGGVECIILFELAPHLVTRCRRALPSDVLIEDKGAELRRGRVGWRDVQKRL